MSRSTLCHPAVTCPRNDVGHPIHRDLQMVEGAPMDALGLAVRVGDIVVALHAEKLCVGTARCDSLVRIGRESSGVL